MNDCTSQFDPRDIAENKGMSILSYLGFLWLIPFFMRRNTSPYTKFNLNQGLNLLIIEFGIMLLRRAFNSIFNLIGLGLFAGISGGIFTLLSVACFILMIMGIVNTINGTAVKLPIIGKVLFIK